MAEFRSPEKLIVMPGRLEPPRFWVEHIPFAFYLVGVLKPGLIVELGAHSGNSFFAFCQAVKEDKLPAKCYAVDTWLGDKHAGNYVEEVYRDVVKYQQKNYPQIAVLMRMKFDEALAHFENGTVDLLHIDGLHTYEGVKHDFETWLPKLSEKAVVLFHDTQIKMKDFGVWKFWEEISKSYSSFEFYHGCGLGVLVVGKAVPPDILHFIDEVVSNNKYRLFFGEEGLKVYKLYKKIQRKRKLKSMFSIHRIIAKRLKRAFS